jgi:hypothetical protein
MPKPSDYPKDEFFFSLGLKGPGVVHPKKTGKSKEIGKSKKMSAALSKGFKSKVLGKQ